MTQRPKGMPRWQYREQEEKRIYKQMDRLMNPFHYPEWFKMEQYNLLKEKVGLSAEQIEQVLTIIQPKRDWKLFEVGVVAGLIGAILLSLLVRLSGPSY